MERAYCYSVYVKPTRTLLRFHVPNSETSFVGFSLIYLSGTIAPFGYHHKYISFFCDLPMDYWVCVVMGESPQENVLLGQGA